MTHFQTEILKTILENDDVEEALCTTLKVVIDFLKSPEGCQEASAAFLQALAPTSQTKEEPAVCSIQEAV